MARLRAMFEALGASGVRTYINSGNVIFEDRRDRTSLTPILEEAFEEEFGFATGILVRTQEEVVDIAESIPSDWTEDSTMRCYVMFLWGEMDDPAVLDELMIKPDIDDVFYVPGAVVWRVDRPLVTKSGMARLAGTDLYKRMTVRNVNTVRKLVSLMNPAEE